MAQNNAITDKRRTLIFINIIITCIATSLLQTALTTAMPPIAEDFHISTSTGQWLTSAYSLVMAIMMPLTAFLIKRIPTKKLYVSTIAIFLVGTGICMLAPNFAVLMVGRVFQACSNGITTSIAQVILLSIYPEEKRGSIMGWYGLSVGAAPVIAPTIAGILVDAFSWRMIFVCAFAIMLMSLVFTLFVLDDVLETSVNKFDVISFLLSALAFGGITLGIGNIGNGILSPSAIIPLIVGIAGAALFIYCQLHLEHPFLELRTFKSFNFTLSVLNSMMLYFVMMGGSIIMPLYVQNIMGYSATTSGLVTLPGSLVMAIVSPFAGRIYDKIGMKALALTGSLAMLFSALGMCFVTEQSSLIISAVLNVIRSVAIGCMMMPFVTWGISNVNSKNTADGTALLTALRTIAGAIGTATAVGIMNYIAGKSGNAESAESLIHGMHISFAVMSIIAFVMFIIVLLFIKSPAKNTPETSECK